MASFYSSVTWGVLVSTLLASLAVAQNLTPSDTAQSFYPTGDDQIQFSPPMTYGPPSVRAEVPRINLVNLTAAAVTHLSASQGVNPAIQDELAYISPSSPYEINDFSSSDIAVISCDPAPNYQPLQALEDAIFRASPAIVLYSSTHNFCNLEIGGRVRADQLIYSTNSSNAWTIVEQSKTRSSYSGPYPPQWWIGRKVILDNITMSTNTGNDNDYRWGGSNGSPSTAVAMIILYSITGVITALFLVIIITGAIRAHRHPERYGPRNVLGRPRQSRAKGLARAMLDTIPIVKFGERDGDRAKPADVELANAATQPATEGQETGTTVTKDPKVAPRDTPESETTTEVGDSSTSGDITTAAAVTKTTSAPTAEKPKEDVPTCSICTEEFERGQDVRVLPCEHQYHPACIDPWLLNVSGTCPLCRIDLRPTNEQDGENNNNNPRASAEGPLPPPLDPEGAEGSGLHAPNNRASRRLSGFITDILNPSRMQSASREERIAALRRLRETRRQTVTEEAETRRRRRLTARLGETFGVRTRSRDTSPPSSGTGSASLAVPETQSGVARSIAEESIPEERPNTNTSNTQQRQ